MSGSATASTRVTVTDPGAASAGPREAEAGSGASIAEERFRNQVRPVFFDYNKTDILPEGKEQFASNR
jgi:hypothetical protein